MLQQPLGALLRMVAELVAAMEGHLGPDFDAEQTVADFVTAMQFDDAFGEEVEEAHGRITAALKPVFQRLVDRCAEILEHSGHA